MTIPVLLLAAVPQFASQPGETRALGGSWEVNPAVAVQVSQYDEAVPAPDLDGDGVHDLFRMPGYTSSGFQLEVEARSMATGTLLWTHWFGGNADKMLETDDLDGDGIGDLVVSFPWDTPSGRLRALSGADGQQLWAQTGRLSGVRWGELLADGTDMDGDGVRDLLVVDAGAAFQTPVLDLLSGVDGQHLATFRLGAGEVVKEVLRLPRDVDGDGVPDYAIEWFRPGVWTRLGVVSFATGGLLWSQDVTPGDRLQGWESDRDQDGVPDLVLSSALSGTLGFDVALSSRSGATGQVLIRRAEHGVGYTNSPQLTRCGDLDHDGREEWLRAVGGSWAGSLLEVRSGADFRVLQRVYAEVDHGFHVPRARLRHPGDPDGAAMMTYVSASYQLPDLQVPLAFRAALHADTGQVSVAAGGAVVFEHDFPPSEAGRPCLLMVSHAAGTRSLVGSLPVPLAQGSTLTASLLLQIPGLASPLQTLDAAGDGSSTLVLPPGAYPGLAGRTLWFASMTWEGTFGRRASAALPIVFQ